MKIVGRHSFGLDAKFNKALIEGCEADIARHCRDEVKGETEDAEKTENSEDDSKTENLSLI